MKKYVAVTVRNLAIDVSCLLNIPIRLLYFMFVSIYYIVYKIACKSEGVENIMFTQEYLAEDAEHAKKIDNTIIDWIFGLK